MSRLSAVQALPEKTVLADAHDALWVVQGRRVRCPKNGLSVTIASFVEEFPSITIIARPDGRDVGKVI